MMTGTFTMTQGTLRTVSVWQAWTGSSATSLTTGSALAPFINMASTSVTDTAWVTWSTLSNVYTPIHRAPAPVRPADDAERTARMEAIVSKRASIAAEASKRARKLLIECLTPEQRASYEAHRYFDVMLAGERYRINHGTHGNVVKLGAGGKPVARYCVQPSDVPTEDAMLSQKLALELAPAEFFARANVTRIPN